MAKPYVPEPLPYGGGYFEFDARVRARDLLWEHLSLEHRGQLLRGSIRVTGNDTGDIYVIYNDGSIRRARDRADFCLHVMDGEYHVPMEDQILAKKILIEKAEDLFLKTANYRGQRPLRR